jgi:hypothetical protein
MSSYEIGPYSNRLGIATVRILAPQTLAHVLTTHGQDIVSVVLLSLAIIGSSLVIAAVYHLDNKNKLRARVLIALFVSHVWSGYALTVNDRLA